ncbi:tRNA (adenosine(37)-N6)-threonylcarbamoyltransferase complex dimerization subunit type 1 TsaB [Candidatus Mycoplasma pogonae]
MKLFIDSTGEDLFLGLYDQKFNFLNNKLFINLKQKVEAIPLALSELLASENITMNDIDSIYLNLGPGSFVGCRIGLVFARTLAQLLPITIYTTNTFLLLAFQNPQAKMINIKASGSDMFQAEVENSILISEIKIVKSSQIMKLNYEKLKKDFIKIANLFTKVDDILALEPIYIKKPHIGVAK